MASKVIYDNPIQALCTHYDVEHFYDNIFAPVIAHRRRLLLAFGSTVVLYAAARAAARTYRQRSNKKQVADKIHIARMRRQRELDVIKSQLLSAEHAIENEQAVNDLIDAEGPYAVFDAVHARRFRLHDVVRVYQKRCLLAQDLCNPITHMFTEAADQAVALQSHVEQTGEMPPLYGLVYSVKEMYGVAGTDSTSGISSYLNQLAHEDCAIVAAMRRFGAILLCKTNFPQTLYSMSSSNPIYGVTTNPHDTSRGPGGSSSGEGALQALNGTMLGWGSDIGGSVRIPAAFCGISSFKPVNDRFCGRGILEVISSSKVVISTYGMLSRDVRLIALVHKTLLQHENFDSIFAHDVASRVPPIAWRNNLFTADKSLRIGYLMEDNHFPSTPGVRRAVQHAVDLLRERGGHTLVPFDIPGEVGEMNNLAYQSYFGDRGRDIYDLLSNDEVDPNIQGLLDMANAIYKGTWLNRQYLLLLASFTAKRWLGAARAICSVTRPEDLSKCARKRDAYRTKFLDECAKLNLDVLLCPAMSCPALKLGDEPQAESTQSHVIRMNLLNLPAGVVTVTTETVEDQKLLQTSFPETDCEEQLVKKSISSAVGMPLAVQIVSCNPYHEELCLKVMAELQKYCKDLVTLPAKVCSGSR